MSTVIGRRYATALYDLAEGADAVDTIGDQLNALITLWNDSSELRTVFSSPRFGIEERRKVVNGVADSAAVHPILKNTLRLLTDRSRMVNLPEIAEAFDRIAEKRSGRIRAEIITATDLPDAYFEELKSTLEGATGKKVVLVRKKDPSLIGGVVTNVGGRIFDGSLRHRLREVRSHLLTAATDSGTGG